MLTRTFAQQMHLPTINFHFLYAKRHFLYRVPDSQVFDHINCRFEPVHAVASCGTDLIDKAPQLVELVLMDVLLNIPQISPIGFSIACSGLGWDAHLSETFPNSSYDDYYRHMCELCQYASDRNWLQVCDHHKSQNSNFVFFW